MKKLMYGAALAAAMVAPGLAHANTSGSLEVSVSDNDFDYGEFQDLQLGAVLLHDMGGWMLQGEGRTTVQEWDGSSGYYSHGHAAVHGSMDMGGWDFGGFLGLQNYYGTGGITLGVEGRTTFDNFSLDGSIAHASMSDDQFDATQLRIGGAYFFGPNFSINGDIARTDFNSGQDFEVTEFSLGGAYQFSNNVTLFGGYVGTEGEPDVSPDYEGDTIQIGLRFGFNGGTLQENTNDGAWVTAARLADSFKRW
jgi:hypothetical protein